MKLARLKNKRKSVKNKRAIVERAANVLVPGNVHDGVAVGVSVDTMDGYHGVLRNCTINGVLFP